jgi:hypothetical protein
MRIRNSSFIYINNPTNFDVVFQDFGRLLMDGSLAANSVSSNDLVSWKGALGVFVKGIAPKN